MKIFKSQVKDIRPQFKFGVEVPRSIEDTKRLDKKNGNTKWMDAIQKEKDQLMSFNIFFITQERGERSSRIQEDTRILYIRRQT